MPTVLAMKIRTLIATFALASAGLVAAPSIAQAAPAGEAVASVQSCTHTSSGSCIRGGQFCPRASYGRSGWDAQGRRYVCKGNRTHPHWMRP
jgi:hypothetical protein